MVTAHKKVWREFDKLMRMDSVKTRAEAFRVMMREAIERGRIFR
jgi:metal-responsive CopG/Arc/MetJ family transcriptional regulator